MKVNGTAVNQGSLSDLVAGSVCVDEGGGDFNTSVMVTAQQLSQLLMMVSQEHSLPISKLL